MNKEKYHTLGWIILTIVLSLLLAGMLFLLITKEPVVNEQVIKDLENECFLYQVVLTQTNLIKAQSDLIQFYLTDYNPVITNFEDSELEAECKKEGLWLG